MTANITNIPKLRILELYSGIGGMHLAFKESGLPGEIVAAIEINTVANLVYKHNFPNTKCINKNILSLSPQDIEGLGVNCILMSPPCQPYTLRGNRLGSDDPRTSSFLHILNILPHVSCVNYIVFENVVPFMNSDTRELMVSTLNECRFKLQEFLITPVDFGIPNSRPRYYFIARRQLPGVLVENDQIADFVPGVERQKPCAKISTIIDTTDNSHLLLPDNLLLRRAWLLDICTTDDNRTCCFTKGYSHYVEGTGSVFTPKPKAVVDEVFREAKELKDNPEQLLICLKQLGLRYFSPDEEAKLMCFPSSFQFPDGITLKQKYRLLGNSINVKVVAALISSLNYRKM